MPPRGKAGRGRGEQNMPVRSKRRPPSEPEKTVNNGQTFLDSGTYSEGCDMDAWLQNHAVKEEHSSILTIIPCSRSRSRSPVHGSNMPYCSEADDRIPHKMRKLTPSPSLEKIILSVLPSRSRSRSKSSSASSTNSTASVNSSDPSARTSGQGWTSEKDHMLIEMWRDQTHLYDMNHKDHKNPDKRRATIERFAAVLDMPYDVVSKHMRTLRTNYTRMVHMPSGSGRDGLSDKKKAQRRLMSFLRPYVSSRSSSSNNLARESKTQEKSSGQSHSKVKAGTSEPKPGTSTERVIPLTLTSGVPDVSDFEDGDHNPHLKVTQIKPHTKSQADPEVLMENVAQSLASMADAVSQRSRNTAIPQDERNNSNVLWCRLLAIKLAKLDDIEAELFKHKVDGMILDILKKKD